jgi:hypothetical protein
MGVGVQRHAPAAFTPRKGPVPIVQEAWWAPGPFWIGAENLVPTGIRSPELPARSKSLYRLRYPGPLIRVVRIKAFYYVISLVECQNILTVFIFSACHVFQRLYSKPRCANGPFLKHKSYLDVIFKCIRSSGCQKRWVCDVCERVI